MMRRFVCQKNYVHLQNYGYKVTRWNLRWNLYDSVHCVAVLRWLLICKKKHKPRRGGWGMEVRTDQGPRQNVPAVIAVCWTSEAYVRKVCEGRGLKHFLHLHAVAQPTS